MTALVWTGVAILGGLGAVCRFLVDRAVSARAPGGFPYGTLAVNLSGALLLGFLSGLALPATIALVVGTGFVGSYTTFSTWMLETQRLGEERQIRTAVANLAVSVVLGLTVAGLGVFLGGRV
ncbi:fluoride efflux transporter CrcB [Mycolicibacterium goodii]|uniref:fluoride efflux transporter CrcB n=1 Tax=Mycolicibacterium goodii TaxID=134601 RepID=UPI000938E1D7|nr:fluoride efflux transporter CrcB [Mycolicibacterium goodii]OKH71493.1 camphor resistance protein CrcB [Mycobacterium sp. SWH-M5]MBU8812139.1 fluoride efflux transporter CrcB [Mycolicibacterium goodii]MBU8816293.1 fluoride efflux transporter CrcB [Mycolicibacterium goodii]MBU8834137.1 fluoride efflux transporter CrcB [Mycolicibacterium goodii]PJK20178.1 fluoride efflux transporter CrcB [Mycolicibacterium goodii]